MQSPAFLQLETMEQSPLTSFLIVFSQILQLFKSIVLVNLTSAWPMIAFGMIIDPSSATLLLLRSCAIAASTGDKSSSFVSFPRPHLKRVTW